MRLYLDESGYTGEDLINTEQPIFVLASTNLFDNECKAIYRQVFTGIKTAELKHSVLRRSASGRKRIIEFVKTIKERNSAFATFTINKEFALVTKLIDLWVEPALHKSGIDLYRKGANIALSNVCFFCLRTFQSSRFLRKHLRRFQEMMRRPTPKSYRVFWNGIYADYNLVDQQTKEILVYFLGGERILGYQYLLSLPARSLDLAFPTALAIINHWRQGKEGFVEVIHDKSSNMSREQWIWDALVSPGVPPAVVGYDRRKWQFPLNVKQTRFVDSKAHLQLQYVDLLAGSTAAWAQSMIDESCRNEYTDTLNEVGIEAFKVNQIWPFPEVKVIGGKDAADPVEYFSKLIPKRTRSARAV